MRIQEIEAGGFTVRAGFTGSGVTVLYGRTYFGSWRATLGSLVWSYSDTHTPNYFADNVEDAVRHTVLLVLRRLEAGRRLTKAS